MKFKGKEDTLDKSITKENILPNVINFSPMNQIQNGNNNAGRTLRFHVKKHNRKMF